MAVSTGFRFLGQRALLIDSSAHGLLRKELIDLLGYTAARTVITRSAYAHGWRIAETVKHELPEVFHRAREGKLGPLLCALHGFGHIKESRRTDGEGDDCCRVIGRYKEKWGEELLPHRSYYQIKSVETTCNGIARRLARAEKTNKGSRLEFGFLQDTHDYETVRMTAHSQAMQKTQEIAQRIAKVDSSVVITGESGVGKERMAQLIHEKSSRASKPFLAVNCCAMTETLLDSELFGHTRGAFTGADRDREGLFEAANGGTLFLDEIGDISPGMQVKLLRALQEKQIRRVGENRPRPINVRIISATNRKLHDDVVSGRFRQDLFTACASLNCTSRRYANASTTSCR